MHSPHIQKDIGKFLNTFCNGFKSPPFKAISHAGISGLRSPGIYAWEDVTGELDICKTCGKSLGYRPSVNGYTCSNKNCENYWGKWRGNVFRSDK